LELFSPIYTTANILFTPSPPPFPLRLQNRTLAWTMLRARVHAHRLAIKQEKDRLERKSQIPGMDRGDKIRTWNFPQVSRLSFSSSSSFLSSLFTFTPLPSLLLLTLNLVSLSSSLSGSCNGSPKTHHHEQSPQHHLGRQPRRFAGCDRRVSSWFEAGGDARRR